ncbi:MAG TPA: serine/threonine-protein kinase, partial [Acetobacteraceae bacterium]
MAERLGKYEIRGVLGKGAMGTVYDAHDPVIDRRVAIKTIALGDAGDSEVQEELARFKREAQAAGRLAHPNIVGVFDYGETDSIAFIVMEFVDGPSLKSLLEKQERFSATETVRILSEVLAGLAYSHARGVVHRDIKPANVMLTESGQAKIADFGIARIESSSMTQAGTIMGTPAYMSPEQFMGQTVDSRTDIYSCGVMLYQMLTGERPFEGGMTAIMHKALNTAPPRPSELSVTAPASLDPVVARAMAKRPEDRYATAAEMATALRGALQARPALADSDATMVATPRTKPAPPPTPSSLAPKPGRNRGALLTGVVAAMLLLGGGTFLLLRGQGGRTPEVPVAQAPVTPAPTPPATQAEPVPPAPAP